MGNKFSKRDFDLDYQIENKSNDNDRADEFDANDDDIMVNPLFEKKKSLDINHNLFRSYSFAEKNKIPKELNKFNKTLPCLLKYDSEGNIESYKGCLEEISLDKIVFQELNQFSVYKLESNASVSLINNKKVSLGMAAFQQEIKGEIKISNSKKYSSTSKIMVAKKKLYSISIKEEDISINDFYSDKLETLAENYDLDDNEKAKELENLLEKTGYYIPLTVYIGGLYTINCENMTSSQQKELLNSLELDLKFSSIESKNALERKKTFERSKSYNLMNQLNIGGKTNKKFEDWIESINLENSGIIEYSQFTNIEDFIDDEVKASLKVPLNIVHNKFKNRMGYLNIKNNLERYRNQLQFIDKSDNLKIGICDVKNQDIIDCDDSKSFYMKNKLFGDNKKDIFESFSDIIIGLEIINKSSNPTAAKYTFENPIGKQEINIHFQSKKDINFYIKIYILKEPK